MFPGPRTGVPLVEECVVNVECTVREQLSFSRNETFLGEVMSVLADENLVSGDHGKIDFQKLELFVFNQGEYWSLFERIGRYGFSRGKGHVDRLSETR
jgi:flavin reductase (DIM6/NTAB) family NADH-FMN oxidoreductase RutF